MLSDNKQLSLELGNIVCSTHTLATWAGRCCGWSLFQSSGYGDTMLDSTWLLNTSLHLKLHIASENILALLHEVSKAQICQVTERVLDSVDLAENPRISWAILSRPKPKRKALATSFEVFAKDRRPLAGMKTLETNKGANVLKRQYLQVFVGRSLPPRRASLGTSTVPSAVALARPLASTRPSSAGCGSTTLKQLHRYQAAFAHVGYGSKLPGIYVKNPGSKRKNRPKPAVPGTFLFDPLPSLRTSWNIMKLLKLLELPAPWSEPSAQVLRSRNMVRPSASLKGLSPAFRCFVGFGSCGLTHMRIPEANNTTIFISSCYAQLQPRVSVVGLFDPPQGHFLSGSFHTAL